MPIKKKVLAKGKQWCFGNVRDMIKEKNSKWWSLKKCERKDKVIKRENIINCVKKLKK